MVRVNLMPRGARACLPGVTDSYPGPGHAGGYRARAGEGTPVFDMHERNLGYNLTSMALHSVELRLIEVKGLERCTGPSC